MTQRRSTQQSRCSSRSSLLLACSVASLLLLPTVVSACSSSSDCNGAVCALSSPSASTGSCSCSDNSYEADGQLSSSAASPSCSDTVSSLYPAYFLAHRVVLLLLWSALCLLSLLCLRRLFRASKATSRTLPSLLLLLLVSLSKLAYNACDPLDAAGLLPPLLSLLFLFIDDVALLAAYCLLFSLLRDLLLLSPLVSDRQYERLVHTAHMLHLSLASCLLLLCLLLAALWVGQLRPVYLALVVVFIAAFTASTLSKLYRLAARDRKAVRRVSVASVSPLPVRTAVQSAVSVEVNERPSPSPSPTMSLSATVEVSSVTLPPCPQPADSPQSSQSSASRLSADHSRKPLSSHMTVSTHSLGASQAELLQPGGGAGAGAEEPQKGRWHSTMVVAVEAGRKPIKTYTVHRVNVRRLLRLHALLAVSFLVYYSALLSRVSTADIAASSFFSSSLSALSVITVHLTKDVLQWLWCCLIVATVWPSSLALQKASAKRERKATVQAAVTAAAAPERAANGAREELSALVQQNPVLARTTSARRGSLDSPHAANVAAAVEDDDDDDQSAAENSRARAIALMSSTAAFMQTLDSRSSLGFVVSSSPTSAAFFAPPTTIPPPVHPFSLSDDPTALLEPPCVLPAEPQRQLPFVPSTRGLTAVRHSLPAIQIDPIILARVMRTMTEPSTPKGEGSNALNSPAAAAAGGGAAGGSSGLSLARLSRPDAAVLLQREAERDDAGGDRPAPLRQSSIEAAAGKQPPSASSRAARPASASQASRTSAVQSLSSTVPAAAAGGSGGGMMSGGSFGGFEPEQERERSRFESLLKETISPRTTSSQGSRQRRIFAPTSSELDQ